MENINCEENFINLCVNEEIRELKCYIKILFKLGMLWLEYSIFRFLYCLREGKIMDWI